MESEISRRKEHMVSATNFAKARGFVRSCWKTKNYDPDDDPLTALSSSVDSDEQEDFDFKSMQKKNPNDKEAQDCIVEIDEES